MRKFWVSASSIILLIMLLIIHITSIVSDRVYLDLCLTEDDFVWQWISIPGPWNGPNEELYFEPGGVFIYSGASDGEDRYGTWKLESNSVRIIVGSEIDKEHMNSYTIQELQPTYLLEGKSLSIDSIVYNGTRFWKQYGKHDWEIFGGDYPQGNGELNE